jgi:hypothetical protein
MTRRRPICYFIDVPNHYLTEAEAEVAHIADPDLKKIAFQAELNRVAERRKQLDRWLGYAGGFATVVAVAIGIFTSVAGYNDARQKEAVARQKEAEARQAEAIKPFIEMKRQRYAEILQVVGALAAQKQDPEKLAKARVRFWELYWAELTVVEDEDVEAAMVHLGELIDPGHETTALQDKTLDFAKLIRRKITTLQEAGAGAAAPGGAVER